ncbi:MAG: hypothetical protein CL949_11070 [Erythrobacter sp.]|nr:hypothetical protein [Erythrobacter sp.]
MTSKRRSVSKDEFFAVMGPLDVHPNNERDITHWRLRDRTLVGQSEPGWMPDGKPNRYFIIERA